MEKKPKLFLSGRISGNRHYKEEFEQAKEFYENLGYFVVIPSVLPNGMTNADYARICLSMIDCCDEVAFLCDWPMSLGAQLEHSYCHYTGKKMRYYEEDLGNDAPVYTQPNFWGSQKSQTL